MQEENLVVAAREADMLSLKKILDEKKDECDVTAAHYEIAQAKLHSEDIAKSNLTERDFRRSRAMA